MDRNLSRENAQLDSNRGRDDISFLSPWMCCYLHLSAHKWVAERPMRAIASAISRVFIQDVSAPMHVVSHKMGLTTAVGVIRFQPDQHDGISVLHCRKSIMGTSIQRFQAESSPTSLASEYYQLFRKAERCPRRILTIEVTAVLTKSLTTMMPQCTLTRLSPQALHILIRPQTLDTSETNIIEK